MIIVQFSCCRSLLDLFKNQELIHWKEFCQQYEPKLKGSLDSVDGATGVFDDTESGKKRWENLKDRVVEHV